MLHHKCIEHASYRVTNGNRIINSKNPNLELKSVPPPIKTCITGYTAIHLGVYRTSRMEKTEHSPPTFIGQSRTEPAEVLPPHGLAIHMAPMIIWSHVPKIFLVSQKSLSIQINLSQIRYAKRSLVTSNSHKNWNYKNHHKTSFVQTCHKSTKMFHFQL